MAQSITLTIDSDAEANYLFDGLALKWGFDSGGSETKKEFITRITGELWKTEAIQGYMKGHEQTERGSIDSIIIVGT